MSGNTSLDTKLEQRLKRASLINEDDIGLVRDLQKDSPLSLAEALVELDLLSAAEVSNIIASLYEERSVRLEDVQIDLEAVKHVPRRVAMECRCIPIRKSGNTLVIAVSSADSRRVRESLRAVTDFEIVMLLAEHDAIEHALFVHYGDAQTRRDSAGEQKTIQPQGTPVWSIRSPWRDTFETLVEHGGVARARELAKQIASGGRDSFHMPVMMIGPTGCGKSHVLAAVKDYCLVKDPTLKGILCTGVELKSSIADNFAVGTIDALRFELRDCSLLLIDDFEAAWGNETVENEIATTIQCLNRAGAAVVVAMSNTSFVSGPATQALREMLASGTEAHMALPDADGMSKILKARCSANLSPVWQDFVSNANENARTWQAIRDFSLSKAAENKGSSTILSV